MRGENRGVIQHKQDACKQTQVSPVVSRLSSETSSLWSLKNTNNVRRQNKYIYKHTMFLLINVIPPSLDHKKTGGMPFQNIRRLHPDIASRTAPRLWGGRTPAARPGMFCHGRKCAH